MIGTAACAVVYGSSADPIRENPFNLRWSAFYLFSWLKCLPFASPSYLILVVAGYSLPVDGSCQEFESVVFRARASPHNGVVSSQIGLVGGMPIC